jgi:hypothetical protein|tara:strand:+ start:2427 stop:3038 length:612 start_codon:yes stop_codon:yes gene_type:complete
MVLDLFLVYQFIRRLATPFEKWPSFESGVIDKDGNILKGKKERNLKSEKDSFGKYDLMMLKLKKLLGKIPGGSSRIASYAAALWLIKEWNHFTDKSMLNESITERSIDRSLELFLSRYSYYNTLSENVNHLIESDDIILEKLKKSVDLYPEIEEEVPANNVGGGGIAGMDGGHMSKAAQKKWTNSNKSSKKKRLRDIIGVNKT